MSLPAETVDAIKYWIAQIGSTGIKGDKGDPGPQGMTGPAGQPFCHFYISGGHLYVEYAEEPTIQPFRIDSATGHLMYVIE